MVTQRLSGKRVDRGKRRHVSRALSSEITAFWVPTLLPEGEGYISHSVIASYGRTLRSRSTLACVEASCTGIGRPVNFPVFKDWNGRIQLRKISCGHGVSGCALTRHKRRTRNRGANTGWGGEGAYPYVHLIMFHILTESDNNIVPEKQANKGNTVAPAESVEGRTLTERNIMEGATVRT